MEKKCTKCHEVKNTREFYKRSNAKSVDSVCKSCVKIRTAEARKKMIEATNLLFNEPVVKKKERYVYDGPSRIITGILGYDKNGIDLICGNPLTYKK